MKTLQARISFYEFGEQHYLLIINYKIPKLNFFKEHFVQVIFGRFDSDETWNFEHRLSV